MTLELTDPRPVDRAEEILSPGARVRLADLEEEAGRLKGEVDPTLFARHYEPAKRLVSDLCLSEDFVDFLTLPAYEQVK